MYDIFLIRHGATRLNSKDTSIDRLRGWIDIDLSAEGREEVKKFAEKLKAAKQLPDLLFSSDLKRAHETADIVSDVTGIKLIDVTKGLRPWNVGDFSGKVSSVAVEPLIDIAQRTPNKEVPNGESFNDFRGRFFSCLAELAKKYGDHSIGIVCHHRNERLMKAWEGCDYDKAGKIDFDIFKRKGESTTHCELFKIPLASIEGAARNGRSRD